jgi:hypothetical protein
MLQRLTIQDSAQIAITPEQVGEITALAILDTTTVAHAMQLMRQ